uniref:ABC transporter n=1 Tax=Thermosporothrix sp. COM3 TaxID=2490863 RepID=A0A455SG67_9CHLR|nr:ABC transporter [Thermosporothrix sp. COM3]
MAHILAGLNPEAYDRIYTDRQLLQRIGKCFRPHLLSMAAVVAIIIVNASLGVLSPLLIANGIDRVVKSHSAAEEGLLIGAILAAGLGLWVCGYIQKRLGAKLVGDIVQEIRLEAFQAVMSLDMSFFDERSTGAVVSRITSDTTAFGSNMTMVLNVLSQFLLLLILLIVLLCMNVGLTLITLVLALLIVGITLAFRRFARQLARTQQRSLAHLNAVIEETISGIAVAKNFRQEKNIYEDMLCSNQQWFIVTLRMNAIYTGIFPFLMTCTGLGTVAIVFFGGHALYLGSLSAGQWFLFLEGVQLFWNPLTSIASFWSQFQQGLAAGERVFSLIDTRSHLHQTECQPLMALRGQIEFKDVIFQYNERETVLKKLSLTINAGETAALVGHTGAGKSSITRLIARLYEFQGGQILIDGRDIRSFDLEAYRRHVGIVPQMPFLFSGTVGENIHYARPDARYEEVLAAARSIAGGDWLRQLSQGLNTPVGERGKNLSAGQRQLVVLARVMLQNPSIVILDEATASIDPLTEAQIQQGLDTILVGRTAIVIAHRLPTVYKADRIIVLEKGQILEQGTHETLLQSGKHYKELYRLYFQHQLPEFEVSDVHG